MVAGFWRWLTRRPPGRGLRYVPARLASATRMGGLPARGAVTLPSDAPNIDPVEHMTRGRSRAPSSQIFWATARDRRLADEDVVLTGNAFLRCGKDGLTRRIDPATITPQRRSCACRTACGDVHAAFDHPLAVCRGLPGAEG